MSIKTVTVYGASDDLIEVDGDVTLEGSAWNQPVVPVNINGVEVLQARYTDGGLWRLDVTGQVPGVTIEVHPTPGEDEQRVPPAPAGVPDYSDYAVITGPLEAVTVPGDSWP